MRMLTGALVALTALLGACVEMEMIYAVDDEGRPVVHIKRENFFRVGQGIQEVTINHAPPLEEVSPPPDPEPEEAPVRQTIFPVVEINQWASEDAMSEQLKQAWKELNRTTRFIAAGTALGAVAGNPVAGGVAGGVVGKATEALNKAEGAAEEAAEEVSQ